MEPGKVCEAGGKISPEDQPGQEIGTPVIILASASPRRRQLLAQIGIRFSTIVSNLEEKALDGEKPADFVVRMAREKAQEVSRRENPGLPVLGADTAVIVDGRILGKPGSREEAVEMLKILSGRTHEVFSAVAIALDETQLIDSLSVSRVTFAELEDDWIESYCDTGDSMDKAGAYGVQGKAAEKISRIEGSFYGVMGLPLYETSQLLKRAEVLF
jgi:septum formation protein